MGIPKTALVTGGSKRIGAAICESLAHAGYAVVIHYNHSLREADALAKKLRDAGAQAAPMHADLRDTAAIRSLPTRAADVIGPVGLLVNNASLFIDDDFDIADEAIWDSHFALHLKAPSLLTAAIAAQLPEENQGLVVNMIDQRVLKPNPRFASYALSKNALWSATKMMAQRYAPRLRVNALSPGPTLPSARQSDKHFQAQVEAVPLKTGPGLEEFGRSILYLAETPSLTGQMIALDGGQHLAWETPDLLVKE